MPFDIFLLVIVSILVVGAILFFLTGFIIVKKNHIAIIEKAGQFEGIYESGCNYFKEKWIHLCHSWKFALKYLMNHPWTS